MLEQKDFNGVTYYRIIPKNDKFSAFGSGIDNDIIYESLFIKPSSKDDWLSKSNSRCPYCDGNNYDIYDGSDYGDITCIGCDHKFVFYDWDVEKELIHKFEELKDELK
jgi:hypothetical protein